MNLIEGRNTKLLDTEFYTEGPALDAEGHLYFTMLSGGAIMRRSTNGVVTTWAKSDCPNGQIILKNQEHLACDSKLGRVVRFSASGALLGYASPEVCAGLRVNVPNDLLVDARGDLYFTDSIRHHGSVFKIAADGKEELIATGLDYPNGIEQSKDGNFLFVAESYQNRIIRFDLRKPAAQRKEFEVLIDLPANPSGLEIGNLPDGIALNNKGVLAVAHYGMQAVQLVNLQGQLLASYDSGMPCTSNVLFLDDETLVVTGGYAEPGPGAVFKLEL